MVGDERGVGDVGAVSVRLCSVPSVAHAAQVPVAQIVGSAGEERDAVVVGGVTDTPNDEGKDDELEFGF